MLVTVVMEVMVVQDVEVVVVELEHLQDLGVKEVLVVMV
jgi:hypothetical protein